MNLIYCLSAPQSGTWFVLRFFERLGYRIEHTGEIVERTKGRSFNMTGPIILHSHIFPFYYNPSPLKESWPSFGGDPIQEYIVRKHNMSISGIKLLCNMFKTVIPIRDPLASLLTRESRAPNLRHFYIVDAYVELARLFANHPNVKFLPIDLDRTVEEKRVLLNDIVIHCGIDAKQHKKVIGQTASMWKPENKTPNNRFHKLYENKDIKEIQRLLGPKWAEVVHLKNMTGILGPFLTKLGYNRQWQLKK